MSYTKHNFRPKQILTSADLNEMDTQIELNTQASSQSTELIGDGTLDTTAQTLIGAVNELKPDVDKAVHFTTQTLTNGQKAQARANIAAASITDSPLGIVIGA